MDCNSIPENTGRDQAGKFIKGQSGNPTGKPKGALHKATRAALALMEGQLEELTQVVINAALAGDMTATKIVFDKLIPQAKEAPIEPGAVTLPELSGASVPDAVAAIVHAVAEGSLPPGQGQQIVAMLDGYRKATELAEIEARLTALEQSAGGA
ncbi:MAG: hypothetical protein KUA37_07155 [Desulfomicrobium sp.]|nr:hypothetical protein [Pseudomonadota bacterium]MBV1711769.1 hypothetical protein [Desulfomicrobium sp.]MBU4572643.1 hypothetical protein [Pseudomonadota bacterium]MBU4593576.1 hypothetical protein [Pseudomonadota bacterium]MBV1719169.1 hypothetical protein [Desulfomicrobium sp.]